jgi:isocitrate/isopropylmalate dehydrogenase
MLVNTTGLDTASLADRAIIIAIMMVATSDEGPEADVIEDASKQAVAWVNDHANDLKTPTAIDDVTKHVGTYFGKDYWD